LRNIDRHAEESLMLYLLFISRYEGGDVRFLKIYGEKKKL
jgi:hypothetical protein